MNVPSAPIRVGEVTSMTSLFTVLCTGYVVLLVLSNLIAGKLVAFGGMEMDAANVLFPLTYILGDVFAEVYGFRRTRFVIWLGFGASLLAVAVYSLTLWLPYPTYWTNQAAFEAVFSTTPRVFGASLIAYLAGEFSNAFVLMRLKVLTKGRCLWIRTIGSSIVGEGLDTVLFVTIAFGGLVPNTALVWMLFSQYVWKLGYEILLTPVTCHVINVLGRLVAR